MVLLARLWRDKRGQDMTEYALIAGFVGLAAVATVPSLIAVTKPLEAVLATAAQVLKAAAGVAPSQ